MTDLTWTREGSGDDIAYVARGDDGVVATVYRGGDRYYPWSVTMPGHRIGNALTLESAKRSVDAALREPGRCEWRGSGSAPCRRPATAAGHRVSGPVRAIALCADHATQARRDGWYRIKETK